MVNIKFSLYDTTEAGKLQFGEDFDQDGVKTLVEFSNHWSWIYTLNNNPESADGTSIWKWAANYNVADTSAKTDDKKMVHKLHHNQQLIKISKC